jgi:hypothetical protein
MVEMGVLEETFMTSFHLFQPSETPLGSPQDGVGRVVSQHLNLHLGRNQKIGTKSAA